MGISDSGPWIRIIEHEYGVDIFETVNVRDNQRHTFSIYKGDKKLGEAYFYPMARRSIFENPIKILTDDIVKIIKEADKNENH